MTSQPPDEALHFRGETLTPESPRPLHAAEPGNIPVLENQMDPVFNDTSTYETARSDQTSGKHMVYHADGQQNWGNLYYQPSQTAGPLFDAGTSATARNAPPTPSQGDGQATPKTVTVPDDFSHAASEAGDADPKSQIASVDMNPEENHKVPSSDDGGGVDFENLLDNLSRAPVTTSVSYGTHGPQATYDDGSSHNPQPQEEPSTNSDYSPTDETGSNNQHSLNASDATAQYSNEPTSNYGVDQGWSATNSLHPSPNAGFQQSQVSAVADQGNRRRSLQSGQRPKSDEDTPWGPEVQKKYDEFLHDERIYVTEGLWDRFPYGSRLFVGQYRASEEDLEARYLTLLSSAGNLPTERVTKRDLFHIFHKYGKLAQISIKQAYGFIQFLDVSSCRQALAAEQGASVRGRKIRMFIKFWMHCRILTCE